MVNILSKLVSLYNFKNFHFKKFRYATTNDIMMMIIGSCGSIGAGASIPLMMLFFTNIIDNYTQAGIINCPSNCSSSIPLTPLSNQSNQTNYDLLGQVNQNAIYLCSK